MKTKKYVDICGIDKDALEKHRLLQAVFKLMAQHQLMTSILIEKGICKEVLTTAEKDTIDEGMALLEIDLNRNEKLFLLAGKMKASLKKTEIPTNIPTIEEGIMETSGEDGSIYMVDLCRDFYKVGRTNDFKERFRHYQHRNPGARLIVVKKTNNMVKSEAQLLKWIRENTLPDSHLRTSPETFLLQEAQAELVKNYIEDFIR